MQPTASSPLTFRRRVQALALSLAAALSLLLGATLARAAGDDRVFLIDSFKAPSTAAQAAMASTLAVKGTEKVELQFTLRMRDFAKLQARIASGEHVSQAEMAARYYPLAADYQALAQWAHDQGFKVLNNDPLHLTLIVQAPVSSVEKALATQFAHVAVNGKTFLAAQSTPSVPVALAAPLLHIGGLQPYLQAKRMSRRINPQTSNRPPYLTNEILRGYNATNLNVTGQGQTIAILIDTVPNDSDITAFWQANGVPQSLSNIKKINVNNVTLPDPEGEETLDVSWTSGIAPAAKINIYASGSLYFTDLDKAYQRIIQDLQGGAQIGQLSISLGLGEFDLPSGEATTESQYYVTIANYGVSVFVSSGDDGSNFGSNNRLQVSYSASDPSVTGVGGTSLTLNLSTGAAANETVWKNGDGATGGGISALFARPSYQQGNGITGTKRLVPDVALVADPETGCYLVLKGEVQQFGGTSWSAPVWAGFTALINEARANVGLKTMGLINPLLYPLLGTNNFRDITVGNNGAYSATAGYDKTTGIGVPVVNNLLATLISGGKFTVTGFTPTSGVVGTNVVINGTRLDHTVSITFNGVAATFTKNSSVQVTAVAPAGASTGPLTLVDDAGTVVTTAQVFTVLAPGAGINDPFVNAIDLGVPPVSVTGSNVKATSEPGEPQHAGKPGGASIWYKFTPTDDGVYSLNTYGSSFDTLLAVYTGDSVNALTEVASNDDAAGLGTASSVAFNGTAGITYYVAVDGLNPEDGSGPAEGTVVLNLTNNEDEPIITDFKPQRGGIGRTVRILGGNFLAVNSVQFNGTPAPFTTASNTLINTRVPEGATTGPITVSDTAGNSATSLGTFTVVPTPANDAFANGTVIDGVPTSLSGTNTGASKEPGEPDHAGNEGGESVWFTWKAQASGTYVLNTAGSDFDTLLAVYTGDSVNALTEVASNDDGGLRGTSALAFRAVAGTTYHIAIDGYEGADGLYNLNLFAANSSPTITVVTPNRGGPGVGVAILGSGFSTATGVKFNGVTATFRVDSDSQISTVVPTGATTGPVSVIGLNGTAVSPSDFTIVPLPANDNFANSQVLVGAAPLTATGSNAGATRETGEPQIIAGQNGGRSIWYTWTPPTSGDYVITTRGSDFDTILGVFTGSTLTTLTEIASNDDDPIGGVTSALTFTATRGVAYRIAVDGANGDAGNVTLNILTTTSILNLYATAFEDAEGYSVKAPLAGQNDWLVIQNTDGSEPGGNGVVGNQFPSLGQSAYVGLVPPGNNSPSVQVYHDLAYTLTADNPLVTFTTVMKITPSTNGHTDRFGFTASSGEDNSQDEEASGRYFSLEFDNSNGHIYYRLNDGSARVDTGVTFVQNAIYTLQLSLDFQNNLWSATLNGATVVSGAPVSVSGDATDLTRISADWFLADPANPGDNYMAFDQYSVDAPAATAPVITTQPASQTAVSGNTVLFSVVATGTPPLLYQWYFQGQPITGATLSTYTISSASPNSAGRYEVQIRNNYGTTTSLPAFLVVSTLQSAATSTVEVSTQTPEIIASSGQNGIFLFTRAGDLSQAVGVNYQISGSAQPGLDYKMLSGQFTFKAGKASKKIKVKPLDRGIRDGSTVKVNVKVLQGNGYSPGANSKDKLRIQRN